MRPKCGFSEIRSWNGVLLSCIIFPSIANAFVDS